jgi:hypothetical protein
MTTSNVVQFMEPMPVTNAQCCTDPRLRCQKCAAEAIAAASNRVTENDDDGLSIPTINRLEIASPALRRELERQAAAVDDDDTLPIPRMFT